MLMLLVARVLAVGVAGVTAQALTCPTSIPKPASFLVIGASGGDASAACENTAGATTAGLAAGMTAVEVDVSVSRDNVVFLWNHPSPIDPAALAKSKGLFVDGKCQPRFKTVSSARQLVFNQIKQLYVYDNQDGWEQTSVSIPTLTDWMNMFAANTKLERIYIDVKDTEVGLADYLVTHIFEKATSLSITSKIRLLSSDYAMTGALQSALGKRGLDISLASRSFGDEVSALLLPSSSNTFDGVTEASADCYDTAAVGETVSSWSWRGYQHIIKRMVASRDSVQAKENRYHSVLGLGINSVEKLTWLMCAGVDGIFTNKVAALSSLSLRRQGGLVACCNEETTLACLNPFDSRITGQGCASMGLSWNDEEATPCPLFPLDFLNSGLKLKCKKQSFCSKTG